MKKMMAAAAALLGASCALSDSGDSGNLRFSQVVLYAQANDFTTPIAVGVTMPIGVQGTKRPALLNDYPYLESTLEVTGPATVTPAKKDTGKFEAVFPMAGTYVVKAKASSLEDSITVTAAPVAKLALTRLILYTEGASKTCNQTLESTSGIVLKSNQYLELTVTPQTEDSKPLLGVLTLDTQDDGLSLVRTLGMVNTFNVRAPSATTGRASVLFTLNGTSHSVNLQLERDTGNVATCP